MVVGTAEHANVGGRLVPLGSVLKCSSRSTLRALDRLILIRAGILILRQLVVLAGLRIWGGLLILSGLPILTGLLILCRLLIMSRLGR
jgi:hypothetical protein